jgi:hypothetical protein
MVRLAKALEIVGIVKEVELPFVSNNVIHDLSSRDVLYLKTKFAQRLQC